MEVSECNNPSCVELFATRPTNCFSDHKNIKKLDTEIDMKIKIWKKNYFLRLGEACSFKYCDRCCGPISKQEHLISFADIFYPQVIIKTQKHDQLVDNILMVPFLQKFYNIKDPASFQGRLEITRLLAGVDLPLDGRCGQQLIINKLPRPIDQTLYFRETVLNILQETPIRSDDIIILIATGFLRLVEC